MLASTMWEIGKREMAHSARRPGMNSERLGCDEPKELAMMAAGSKIALSSNLIRSDHCIVACRFASRAIVWLETC